MGLYQVHKSTGKKWDNFICFKTFNSVVNMQVPGLSQASCHLLKYHHCNAK
jgi:hypothetical protein